MSFLDSLGGLLKQAASGNASEAEVHGAFDQVAGAVPQGTLADGLSHAFNSPETPPFEQMLAGLFGQSDPNQKAEMLNRIVAALGPAGVAQVLGGAGAAGVLAGGTVTAQQAQQVAPETVQVLAQQAAKQDPSIVDVAAGFYAAHPTLVKAVGAGALALIMSKISQGRT